MKSLSIFFAALLICAAAMPAHAQSPVKKGKWMVDGMVGFQSQSGDLYEDNNGDGTTIITLSPEAMYFFMDQLGIGAVVSYTSTSQGDNSSNSLEIGPRIMYYFKTGNPMWLPFLGAGLFFGSEGYDNGTNNVSNSYTTIALAGGVMLVINQHVGVSGALNYEIVSYKYDGVSDSVSGNKLSILFGFNIFIP